VTGLEAAALGALASGVKFYSAYPMTPSTGVMNHIAERALEFGVVVEQAEDEIAAINMAIGASFAGVRAATGSSGGGFALMVEGLSLAAMTETPLVIFEVQRPGPATGFPTRTEQGDLLFVLFSGHGEFPRAVFAPGSPEECVTLTNKAFDLAEKYQVPAFVVFDQYLGDAQWTYDALEPELVYKDYRLRGEALRALPSYNRYALTAGGVNPLAVPGESQHLVVADSDEHDEAGHMVEDAPTRIAMTKKRLHAKLGPLSTEIAPPILEGGDGGERPEIVLVGWGSSYGVLRETVAAMRARGRAAAMLFFSELWPFPVGDYLEILVEAPTVVCVEGNATGQFAKLFRMETGYHFRRQVLRYDGRPLTAEYILRELHDV
jgi:2-oxoglutarate ferredoxin oxidoreductase subunit alpha